MFSPINVGLIGFGLAGQVFHASFIAAEPRLRLAAVATLREAKAVALYPGAAVHCDTDALIADTALKLIVVAIPNAFHAGLAHKPSRQASTSSWTLTLGRGFPTVRRLLDEASLGFMQTAVLAWDRYRPSIKPGWREQPVKGAGIPADLGPHLADQALSLFEQPERAVASERGDWRRFYAGVTAAIADGAPPPVTAADALEGLRLLAPARRSAAEGRTLAWADAGA